MENTPVLIAGGGPVGLLLGLELAHRGIKSILVERNPTTTTHPKMDITHSRSMEHFRRLDFANDMVDTAVPASSPMDVQWCTKLSEYELCRFEYPCINDQRQTINNTNDGTGPLEPQIRISQIVVEPLLKKLLEQRPLADVRFGWGLTSFVEDVDGVTATITETATGKTAEVRTQYLAGCDGGASTVRKQLGIAYTGTTPDIQWYMTHFRSRDYGLLQQHGVLWHYQAPVHGTLIAQDDDQYWTVHSVLPPGADASQVDPSAQLVDNLGASFDFEIIQANPWQAHLLVAEGYGSKRVWLAGDSAHQYIPTGGYGMNTGVVDAVDLGWRLAATLQGWGGSELLASYEAERRAVALRNREWSWEHMQVRMQIAMAYDPAIHEPSGGDARAKLARTILDLTNVENEGWGVQHGYRYEDSPIIAEERGNPPSFDHEWYKPGTWPGTRPPHVFLKDGSAMFDKFGRDFSLLRFADVDITPLQAAAKERGVPLEVIDIRDDHARELYERDLVLVRPDQFVAWRGYEPPADALTLIDLVRGAIPAQPKPF